MRLTLNIVLFVGVFASQTCGVFAAVQDDEVLENQTLAQDTSVIACNSIEVGPSIWVEPGVYLELLAPEIRFNPEVSVAGMLSASDIECYEPDSLILQLTDPAGFDVCIPEQSVDQSGTTVTVCSDTTCAGGVAGCTLHVTITHAEFDQVSSTIQASAEFDDAQLGLDFSGSYNEECLLSMQNVTAEFDGSVELGPECDALFHEITAVNAAAAVTGDFTITSCPSASILNFLALPTLLDYAEAAGADEIEQLFLGEFICLPP